MKKIFPLGIFLILFYINLPVSGQNGGELFKSTCAACHTINGGRLIGPDLSGIHNRRDNEWLIGFIRSSQKLIKAGDKDAIAIYNEYNKIPMPDNNMSDEQIISIIDHIKSAGGATQAPGSLTAVQPSQKDKPISQDSVQVSADTVSMQYTAEYADEGRALFNGTFRFVNKTAPCMSCHNIRDQSLLGGGRVALDLTFSWSKLGPAGLTAIITNPPFPVMRTAMMNKPLTENETVALISLLKSVDERNSVGPIRQSGGALFFAIGFVAALFILVHVYVFYDNRNIP